MPLLRVFRQGHPNSGEYLFGRMGRAVRSELVTSEKTMSRLRSTRAIASKRPGKTRCHFDSGCLGDFVAENVGQS
jgi:hypothetical protein